MAPDKKDNKRKAAAATADVPTKKSKKVEPKPSEPAKDAPKSILKNKKGGSGATGEKAAPKVKANGESTKQDKPRKRAADFLSDDEGSESDAAEEVREEPKEKPSKKKSKKDDAPTPVSKDKKSKADNEKAPKMISKPKKAEPKVEESDDDQSTSSAGSGDEDGENDQTAALIKGFESSGDEDASEDEGFDPKQPVPQVPDSKKAKRKILKKQKKSDEPEEPGTVYVGRIPHGFYEQQMRAYFSQFGEITRLRLSRNRVTGQSKHYAFVEFASVSVAKIVAATMDNYLIYGHILKCKYVPSEQLHPDLWKGANRRFKKTPWNRIEKKRLEKGKTRTQWADRIDREQKKRQAKAEKLKAIGYEMDLPQLKSVEEVPVREEAKAIDAPSKLDEPSKTIEAPEAKEAEPVKADDTQKKSKKEKKAKEDKPDTEKQPKQDTKPAPKEAKPEPTPSADKKAKKTKKSKGKQ